MIVYSLWETGGGGKKSVVVEWKKIKSVRKGNFSSSS